MKRAKIFAVTVLAVIIIIAVISSAIFQKPANKEGTRDAAKQQIVKISSAAGTMIFLRNKGASGVDTGAISVYVNGSLAACVFAQNSIGIGRLANCTLNEPCTGQTLRIAVSNLTDEIKCG